MSGIAYDSVDGETRSERGSSGAHEAVLLNSYFSCVQCRIHVSTREGLGRDLVTWLVAVRYYSQNGDLWSPPKSLSFAGFSSFPVKHL